MIDVRSAAARLIGLAAAAGFDTRGWGIHRGTQHYNLQFRVSGQECLTNIDVGATAREACGRIEAMLRGMDEMQKHLAPERQVQVLSAAIRATTKIEEHRTKCGHCAGHLIGARTDWCNAYKELLRVWREGVVLAKADHSQKYPVGAQLVRAVTG